MTTTGEPDAPIGPATAGPATAGSESDGSESDGADEASTEGPSAEQLDRLAAALANLDDDGLRRGLVSMRESTRQEVAQHLNLTKATMRLGDALVPLVRRKLSVASAPHRLATAFALTEQTNDMTITALGDRHDDPSRDDMTDVLPDVIEAHGLPMVTLMLAAYAASDAKCQAVFEDLLDTDDRFALPDPPEIDEETASEPTGIVTITRDTDDPEQVAKREQRKQAKAAKREAARAERGAADAAQSARKQAQHSAKRRSGRSGRS